MISDNKTLLLNCAFDDCINLVNVNCDSVAIISKPIVNTNEQWGAQRSKCYAGLRFTDFGECSKS
jgi:hypothetical protein